MRFSSRSQRGLFLVLLLLATGLGLSASFRGVARAANPPLISLSQKVGPPTASVQVTGMGFGLNENVLVDFDTTQIGMATTDATGTFVVRVSVPKTALPGTHAVQVMGQSSGLTASASFLVQTDWTRFHFGLHQTGYNPYENVLSPSTVSALTLDWSYTPGSCGNSLAIANGVVYVGSVKLYALDAVTGALNWSYSRGSGIESSPAVANGVVYFDSQDGNLYARDAMTGALRWSYATGSEINFSPVVANGVVYVGSYDNKLYAFHLPGMS